MTLRHAHSLRARLTARVEVLRARGAAAGNASHIRSMRPTRERQGPIRTMCSSVQGPPIVSASTCEDEGSRAVARPTPGKTPVFHIIPIEKLESVIEHGLLCDVEANRRFGSQADLSAAHDSLKAQRRRKDVPVSVRGVMADYTPFYFGPRSPMLFSIHCGNTEYGRNGRGQEGMIHLVLHLERLVRDFQGRWCFIDAHMTRGWAQFGASLTELDERVDFEAMRVRIWAEDDVKARRQAEFLVHDVVPWDYVEGIVVMTERVRDEVRDVLATSGARHAPPVVARPPGSYPDSAFPQGYYYY